MFPNKIALLSIIILGTQLLLRLLKTSFDLKTFNNKPIASDHKKIHAGLNHKKSTKSISEYYLYFLFYFWTNSYLSLNHIQFYFIRMGSHFILALIERKNEGMLRLLIPVTLGPINFNYPAVCLYTDSFMCAAGPEFRTASVLRIEFNYNLYFIYMIVIFTKIYSFVIKII